MFKKLGSGMSMLKDIGKIQSLVKTSLDEFSKTKTTHEYQNGMLKVSCEGDVIKNIEYSKEYQQTVAEDVEMAQDILVTSLSSLNKELNKVRMEKLKDDAIKSGINPDIVDNIMKSDLLSSF